VALLAGVKAYFLFFIREPNLIDLCRLDLAVFLLMGKNGSLAVELSFMFNFYIVTVEKFIISYNIIKEDSRLNII
jgi:hypothetical protein